MAHYQPEAQQIPKSQPFQQIFNSQIDKIYQIARKQQHKQSKESNIVNESQKENDPDRDTPSSHDRTIRKDNNKQTSITISAKTIKENENILTELEDNPEMDFIESFGGGQIFRLINCSVPFPEIKKVFLAQAKINKLSMCQSTQNFATVKKNYLTSCKCIIKMWGGGDKESTVYQIRSSSKDGRKVKIIMIQGEEVDFRLFVVKFMGLLAKENCIKLTNSDKVEQFYYSHSSRFQDLKKEVAKQISKAKKSTKNRVKQAEQILLKIKDQCEFLKNQLCLNSQIDLDIAVYRQLQQLCFLETGIYSLFELLYRRQYISYQEKRQSLLKKYNLFDIFRQLQIGDHFDQFRRRRDSLRGSNKAIEPLPYLPAIKGLQQMIGPFSPLVILQRALLFQQKVKSCYNEYFINKMRLSDMDDYLPVTIFCVLAMESDGNLLAITKMMLALLSSELEYEWEKKVLTNIEAAFQYICNEWADSGNKQTVPN